MQATRSAIKVNEHNGMLLRRQHEIDFLRRRQWDTDTSGRISFTKLLIRFSPIRIKSSVFYLDTENSNTY